MLQRRNGNVETTKSHSEFFYTLRGTSSVVIIKLAEWKENPYYLHIYQHIIPFMSLALNTKGSDNISNIFLSRFSLKKISEGERSKLNQPLSFIQANLDMTDSMGSGKLVRHMQNLSYTYGTYLICMGLGPSISSVIDKSLSYSGPSYPSSPV